MYALWQSLGTGELSQDQLIAQGRDDVSTQAVTDLAWSQRAAVASITGHDGRFSGYWRVPSPGSSCEFCNEIADQLYSSADLMPAHPGCACSVEPAVAADFA